jgi:hypothetical protein
VASDTPSSHLKQNNALSASNDGSYNSISTSEAKPQANWRELDKSGSQEDEIIHDTLEEGVPGEICNYEEGKGGGEVERGYRDGGVISEHGPFTILLASL